MFSTRWPPAKNKKTGPLSRNSSGFLFSISWGWHFKTTLYFKRHLREDLHGPLEHQNPSQIRICILTLETVNIFSKKLKNFDNPSKMRGRLTPTHLKC